jgi:prepilin-type N-terminal cleavage/methylation domain-containing protein
MKSEIRFSFRQRAASTVTTDRIRGSTDGFTLIEVVVAMVILALGLLGLEALGIGAAKSIALADRQSGYATLASDSLESALHQLRRGLVPVQFCQADLRFGDRMSRQIDLSDPQLARVTIQVIPNDAAPNAPDAFELGSSLYLPVALGDPVQGTACD